MLYYKACKCKRSNCPICNPENNVEIYQCDNRKWDEYWKPFIRKKRPPAHMKPSLGLCAVFGAVERWGIDEVGLIGYDWILDGNEDWYHDAIAEKRCIESLVNIIDLRQRS
jgi:hypothetical protein